MIGEIVSRLLPMKGVVSISTGDWGREIINAIALRNTEGYELKIYPSSFEITELALSTGVPLASPDEEVDVAVEFANKMRTDYSFLKSDSLSLLKDKILDTWAKELIVLVRAKDFGSSLSGEFSVEISRFFWKKTVIQLESLVDVISEEPAVSLTGNYLIRVRADVDDPVELDFSLKRIPGVVETGIFYDVAEKIVVLDENVRVIRVG